MLNKKLTPREILWLVVSIFSLLFAVYATIRDGIARSYTLFLLASLALGMFFAKYYIRINNEGKKE